MPGARGKQRSLARRTRTRPRRVTAMGTGVSTTEMRPVPRPSSRPWWRPGINGPASGTSPRKRIWLGWLDGSREGVQHTKNERPLRAPVFHITHHEKDEELSAHREGSLEDPAPCGADIHCPVHWIVSSDLNREGRGVGCSGLRPARINGQIPSSGIEDHNGRLVPLSLI